LVRGLGTLPGPEIEVARVLESIEHRPSHLREVIGAFRPDDPAAVRAVTDRMGSFDVVVLQHEFGIYGRHEGIAVCDLLDLITVPVVSVLHTVLRRPSTRQRHIVECLAEGSAAVVALSQAAVGHLENAYDVDGERVVVIPHGAHWSLEPRALHLRPTILTWGLISPAKGIEQGILAMRGLRDLTPPPAYLVVGRTHPVILELEGERYRRGLEDLVLRHGLGDVVEFVPTYLDADALAEVVASAHVVLLPYAAPEQVSSGVLSEALAAGKPVVATRFPHAEELLGTGAGVVVDEGDIGALTAALRDLLTDDETYERASAEARRVADRFTWSDVTRRYAMLFSQVGAGLNIEVA
jgi:glycosyltransferase involved in cell wall biosynthesis